MSEEASETVLLDLFSWSKISARIRQIDEEIERRWADYEIESEAVEARTAKGELIRNPRERLDVLFEERGQLLKRQKELEGKI